MPEKPMLMSGEMVRAILDGRKSVTRRPVSSAGDYPTIDIRFVADGWWLYYAVPRGDGTNDENAVPIKPRLQPGDVAWVKESYRARPALDHLKPREIADYDGDRSIYYEAMQLPGCGEWGKLRPSIFMCRWMSRLNLRILDVDPERLQEITEEDAIKEGIIRQMLPNLEGNHFHWGDPKQDRYPTAVLAFAHLYDSIHRPGAWERNGWVWRYESEVVR